VRSVVMGMTRGFRACFEADKQAASEGRVVFRWEISPQGKATGLCLESDSLQSPVTRDCLYQRVKMLRFAEPKRGPCLIRWPFVFRRR
jgi:hypothetical protein